MNWQELNPSDFQDSRQGKRRIAKDTDYLREVLKIWESEEKQTHLIETTPFVYKSAVEETPLFGHLIRRKTSPDTSERATPASVPAILLFHTAAGPQDIFLFYKGHVLAQALDCVVMVCDIMSDELGWGWDPDRTKYAQTRELLMKDDAKLLRSRVLGAIESLATAVPEINIHQVVAMGWCLGGQPILELAALNYQRRDFTVCAMSTFHGVFRRDIPVVAQMTAPSFSDDTERTDLRILICNGQDDPFVSAEDLEVTTRYFRANGFEVETLQLEKARHGFTNPAQEFNKNESFEYSKEGASKAWRKTMELIDDTVQSNYCR